MTNIKDQYLLLKKSSLGLRYLEFHWRVVKALTNWEGRHGRGLSALCQHLDGSTQRWRRSDVLRYATKVELIEAQRTMPPEAKE